MEHFLNYSDQAFKDMRSNFLQVVELLTSAFFSFDFIDLILDCRR